MELLGLCVFNLDEFGLILVVDIGGDICPGAEGEVQDLVELGLRHLVPEEVRELVDPESSSDGGRRRHGRHDLRVAVADGDVFKHVAFVQHVSSPERRLDFVGSFLGNRSSEASSLEIAHHVFWVELGSDQGLRLLVLDNELPWVDIGRQESFLPVDDLHWLHLEGNLAVLREGPDDVVEANESLRPVEGGDLNKDVSGVDGDLGALAVDDGRDGADHVVGIEHKRVNWAVSNEMEIFLQLVVLQQLHHAQAVHLCLLVQRNELEVFRVLGHVLEGPLDSIEVVGSNRGVLPGSAEGVMQLLLGSNEGLVGLFSEGDVPEDGSSDKGPDLLHLSYT